MQYSTIDLEGYPVYDTYPFAGRKQPSREEFDASGCQSTSDYFRMTDDGFSKAEDWYQFNRNRNVIL